MSEHRPDPCHYDRALRARVTREHRDDCPRGHDCPGERGCKPCTAPHCLVCGRNHSTNSEPQTCAKCIGLIREDLADIAADYADLATEALEAGAGGQLVAAAPIPGGTAQVLIGPTVRLDLVRVSRTMRDDHPVSKKTGRPADPLPALAVLAQWEDIYRAWLDHTRARTGVTIARGDGTPQHRPLRRASIAAATRYLAEQVPYLANHIDATAPDFLTFVHQVRQLREDAERVLHDEREPERGVECFECGDQLVRRFRSPNRCRHATPAREWVQTLLSYPDLQVRTTEWAAARLPCPDCQQGGIDNPDPGQSWECPGCRKEYDPGEYANAVRRSLLDEDRAGLGWCTIPTAAAAAADISGKPITPATIRTWISRQDNIGLMCWWSAGQRFGMQLVYWPDVAQRVTEKRTRGRKAAS